MTTTTRRPRGTGAIEALPDGRFAPRMPGNGARMRACATREEAVALLDGAIAELADGSASAPSGTTLAAFASDVLDDREVRGMGSAQADRSRWNVHLADAYFAAWPLRSLTTRDVRAWLATMMRKKRAPGKGHRSRSTAPLSRSTIQSALNLLRVILAEAVAQELIDSNPAKDIQLPDTIARTDEPWSYLLPEEQSALLTCALIPERRRLLIAFAVGTGMREGEVWNLELRDVDVAAGRVTVRFGGRGRATKGKRIRRIPLFGLALAAMKRQIEILKTQDNPCGLAWPHADGSRRGRGEPHWWREALALAGLVRETVLTLPRTGTRGPVPTRATYDAAERHDGRMPRWHDLRHTCGSSLIAGWWGRQWSIQEVKGLLGHRSITTTERYAHLAESVLDAAGAATSSPHHLPGVGGATGAKSLSHLRDLNSRPTVYETGDKAETIREVEPVSGEIAGLSERARAALEELGAGGSYRLAVEVLGDIVRLGERVAGKRGAA